MIIQRAQDPHGCSFQVALLFLTLSLGTQSCSKRAESETKNINLHKLSERPEFIATPDTVFSVENEDAIIKCRANGVKKFVWRRVKKVTARNYKTVATRGRDLGGARFRIPGNEVAPGLTPTVGDLVIKAVTCADEGFYTCIPCNNWGNISASTRLHVKKSSPPVILWKPEPLLAVKEGSSALVKCRVFGWPRPKIKWLYRRRPDYPDQKIYGYGYDILFDGHLKIKATKKYDEGFYKCIAINKYGTAVAEGLLKVISDSRKNGCDMLTNFLTLGAICMIQIR